MYWLLALLVFYWAVELLLSFSYKVCGCSSFIVPWPLNWRVTVGSKYCLRHSS